MFKWLQKLSYVGLGIVLAILIYSVYLDVRGQVYLMLPSSNIFTARVVVPDFNIGDDPVIQYDRTINRDFLGSFTVKLENVSTGAIECYGEGHGYTYHANTPSPNGSKLSWFMNTDCTNDPLVNTGQHFLETTWTIQVEGLPERYVTVDSNTFNIYPKGTVPALTKK